MDHSHQSRMDILKKRKNKDDLIPLVSISSTDPDLEEQDEQQNTESGDVQTTQNNLDENSNASFIPPGYSNYDTKYFGTWFSCRRDYLCKIYQNNQKIFSILFVLGILCVISASIFLSFEYKNNWPVHGVPSQQPPLSTPAFYNTTKHHTEKQKTTTSTTITTSTTTYNSVTPSPSSPDVVTTTG